MGYKNFACVESAKVCARVGVSGFGGAVFDEFCLRVESAKVCARVGVSGFGGAVFYQGFHFTRREGLGMCTNQCVGVCIFPKCV